ncbi:hypothetical protein GOV05_00030 [Candidatus Woesearchaeota archaeon]|nr:hypothetical protein [Candidatus Woesearchaeota archaeon]
MEPSAETIRGSISRLVNSFRRFSHLTDFSDSDLEATTKDVDPNLIRSTLDHDTKYFLCRDDGILYADRLGRKPLIDFQALTGRKEPPNWVHNEYFISGSLCPNCISEQSGGKYSLEDVYAKFFPSEVLLQPQ